VSPDQSTPMKENQGLVAFQLSKAFGENLVLQDVSLIFQRSKVHAVIGENGAGKSTLVKILGGYQLPSSGTLALDGKLLHFTSPKEAEALGIVLVHQEILLAPHLTVAENIFLGRELRIGPFVDDEAMNAKASALLSKLGSDLDPRARVESLTIANRQIAQIARALSGHHDFIIFDEPTAALTPVESEAVFTVIQNLKNQNCGIIYISHKLDEVKRLANTISVLRDGKLVAQQPANKLTAVDMAHLMVGRELGALYPPKVIRTNSEVALQVENLIVPPSLSSANFVLHKGEILGFAGLIGAGRTELFEGLLGLRPATGRVSLGDKFNSVFSSVAAAAKAGLAYVTEDRKGKGLLLNLELTPNLTLSTLQQFTNAGFIQHRLESAALDVAFSRYDIRAKSRDMDAGRLSGGNQQKLLLAKTLQADPSIIIIDEPTRGVDIGAKKQIYELIARLAQSGKSIIVISSEMPELIGLCHRIVVMHRGQLVGTLEGSDINERKIVTLATGTEKQAA